MKFQVTFRSIEDKLLTRTTDSASAQGAVRNVKLQQQNTKNELKSLVSVIQYPQTGDKQVKIQGKFHKIK